MKNKQLKENYSFSPSDAERLIDGSFNISKVSDPIELKRLNNYLTTVFPVSLAYTSCKESLIQLRLKLNQLGYDIDLPRSLIGKGEFTYHLPLKRFGGISGVDDMAQKLDNPYGPGPKLDIVISGSYDTGLVTAKIVPNASAESPLAGTPTPVPPQETQDTPKSTFSLGDVLKHINK